MLDPGPSFSVAFTLENLKLLIFYLPLWEVNPLSSSCQIYNQECLFQQHESHLFEM